MRHCSNLPEAPMTAVERLPEPSNPLGIDGLEFIEYATSQPQAFGALLEQLGFAASLVYFVDRHADFSIYDVDFTPIAGVTQHPPALAGLHYFGVVQSVLTDRSYDWIDFYQHLFGFTVLPHGKYFGVLPKGT